MKKISSLFKFFSLKPATMFALTVATILALVLSACAPIPESERLPPLQPGYGRIIVNTGGVGSRAVTDADKKDARLDVSFNGVSYGHTLHATFKVGTDVRIVVKAYRNDASNEFIGYGTASHTMTYGTNQVTVPMNKVDGYYKVTYEYGDALLGGTYRGITADKNYYKGGEDEVSAPSDDDVTWQHGTLSGWKYNDRNGEQTVGTGQSWKFPMPSADTTLTAQWTRYKYDFTYEDNIPDGKNGTVTGKPQNQSQQDALTKITIENATPNLIIANEAWNFKGYWTDNPEGNGTRYSAGQEITLTKNITLYAQWTDDPVWKITFAEPNNKPSNYTTQMPTNDIVKRGETFRWTNPAARGWSFDGWDVTGSTTISSPLSATTTQVTPDADITLTARWTPIEYTVKFNSGNGSAVNDINKFTVNGSDSFAANPTYTGYTFGGWQYNSTQIADATELRTAIINGSVAASGNNEITLTAQWTANTYKVKYEPNNGTGSVSQTDRTYGQAFTLATGTALSRTGYSFAGWAKANTATAKEFNGNGTVPASDAYATTAADVTFYAVWTANTYKVKYEPNNGTGSVVQTDRTYGQAFTLAAGTTLSRTGYTFAGWAKADNATAKEFDGNGTVPASDAYATTTSDVTFYAVWTAMPYAITWNDVGNLTGQKTTYTIEDSTYTLPAPTKTDYTFAGWYTEAAFRNKVTEIAKGSTGAKQFYAKWMWTANINGQTNRTTNLTLAGSATDVNIEFVGVTGGTAFTMGYGSNSDNAAWSGVTVSSFYMGKYEVTQAQWEAVMGNKGNGTLPSATYGVGDNFPQYYVSWYDALVFCNKLSLLENKTPCYKINNDTNPDNWGAVPTATDTKWDAVICDWSANGYRLPTEAEWEYAARGGSGQTHNNYSGIDSATTPSPTEDDLKTVAWCTGNAGSKSHEVGTTQVKENALGISDMSGNVWEWCWDWYNSGGYVAAHGAGNTSDPRSAASGSARVYRGGSWSDSTGNCKVFYRGLNPPYSRNNNSRGLRLVCR